MAALVASAEVAIVAVNLDGTVQFWNAAAEGLFGFGPDEMIGRNWSDVISPDRARPLFEALTRVGQGETVEDLSFEGRRQDGTPIPVSLTVSPIVGLDERIVGASMIARDLTEQQRSVERLVSSERETADVLSLLETLQSSAPVGFVFVDRDFRYVRVNEKAAIMNGVTVRKHLGRTMAEVVPHLWSQIEPVCREVLDRGETVVNVDITGETAAEPGQVQAWLASFYPVPIGDAIVGIGAVFVDITGRKDAELALDALTHAALDAIAATVEANEPYMAGHQRRVAEIAAAIGQRIGLDEWAVEGIKLAANIRDIGQISVPTEILLRPGRLAPAEHELVMGHSRAGYEIVKGITFPWPVADMVLQHHERLDGSGYPEGLRGDDIVLGARIIGVADVVDSMVSYRPYRAARPLETALEEIEAGRGTLFDPQVVDACVQLFNDGTLVLSSDAVISVGMS